MDSPDAPPNGLRPRAASPHQGQAPIRTIGEQVSLARQAQRDWARTSLSVRLRVVRSLRHLLTEHALSLAETVQISRHNPVAEILAGEVLPLADACRFLEREATRLLRPRLLKSAGRPFWLAGVDTELHREPFGTILIVGPSNYPLFLPGVQAVQALVAGNSVLLKPGASGSFAAAAFVKLCREAGFDGQLIQVLPESPAAALEAVEAGVDKVILTGAAETGVNILQSLAPHLVPATLELSGCDPAFVRPDADLDLVARALRFSLLWNGGATCIASRRVFVNREMAPALEARLVAALQEVPPSPGRWQLDARTIDLVQDALRQGARSVTGWGAGGAHQDYPTILADARVTMPLLQKDVFAPLLVLVPVSSDDEALQLAQQCPYALGATVFGQERAARELAEHVCAGVVVVNDVIVPTADPRLPFGGRGHSGFGVTRGAEGLLEMTVIKAIAARKGKTRWHLDQPHFSDDDLVRHYLEAVHGRTWKRRWSAWCSLFGSLIRTWRKGTGSKESMR